MNWDVCNENLHSHFYEEKVGDPQFLQTMFREMLQAYPDAQLFTNDYEAADDLGCYNQVSP